MLFGVHLAHANFYQAFDIEYQKFYLPIKYQLKALPLITKGKIHYHFKMSLITQPS